MAVIAGTGGVVKVLESLIDTPGEAVLDDFLPEPFPAPDPAAVPPSGKIGKMRQVGYEWVAATEEFRITDEFTVITGKDTGDFITAFPGRPLGQQT